MWKLRETHILNIEAQALNMRLGLSVERSKSSHHAPVTTSKVGPWLCSIWNNLGSIMATFLGPLREAHSRARLSLEDFIEAPSMPSKWPIRSLKSYWSSRRKCLMTISLAQEMISWGTTQTFASFVSVPNLLGTSREGLMHKSLGAIALPPLLRKRV